MKLLTFIALLALATLSNGSLLDMSRDLWSRVVNGGFQRIGKVDPLHIPVVKVDQSDKNTSYRIFLRNLTVSGLNDSIIESVKLARGRLQTNLSDGEAGYVSYNEQRDLDAIRYRFHTLIKEKKDDKAESASEHFDRVIDFDQAGGRFRDEDDVVGPTGHVFPSRRYFVQNDRAERRQQTQEKPNDDDDKELKFNYKDMRVAMKVSLRNSVKYFLCIMYFDVYVESFRLLIF